MPEKVGSPGAFPEQVNARLSQINKNLRRAAERVKRPIGETVTPSDQARFDTLNRAKGRVIADALIFRAAQNTPFFEAELVEDAKPEQVIFTIPDSTRPRGHLRTVTRLDNIRHPEKIRNNEEARAYLLGTLPETKPIPDVKVSEAELIGIGQKIAAIDEFKKTGDEENFEKYRPLKQHFLLDILLPARRSSLPPNCNIFVGKIVDSRKNNSEYFIVEVVIRTWKHSFSTIIPSPHKYVPERGDEIMDLIGNYDFERERKRRK